MFIKLFAIGVGAAGGAWIRWGLGLMFNATLKHIPLGTFLANLVGGFLIGIAVEFFSHNIQLSPEWKLLIITGFLGIDYFFNFLSGVSAVVAKWSLRMGCDVDQYSCDWFDSNDVSRVELVQEFA